MARQSTGDRLADIHREAMEEFDRIQGACHEMRARCVEARRFYSVPGAQWEGPLEAQFENKPRFEMNKVHLAVIRIFNEYRNNRISVNFVPKDGTEADKLADTCAGLYRADEQDSVAQEAYDNCFEEGVGGGFGAWRLRACYEDDEDDDNDKQRVKIEPIFDADTTVFFDLDAKRQDKADAKRCFVLTSMTPEAYEEEFDDDISSWPKDETSEYEFDWATPDVVYVAEYYRVEEVNELTHVFRGLDDEDIFVTEEELKAEPDKLSTLTATGFREVRQKRIKRKKVHKYLLSGSKVLEDEGFIAGRNIPIVPFFGKRQVLNSREIIMGHVHLAMDAQRLTNMMRSKLAEIVSYSSIEKPIVTPEQMAGHSVQWANDNIENYPYLLLNRETDANGQPVPMALEYSRSPGISPALAALMQINEQDLQDLLGNQQAGEQLQPNMSGKAVELVQQRLDMQVFIYMSNFAKAMKRSGEIWLSMAKDLIVEKERRMKVIGEDGGAGSTVMNDPSYDKETGEEYDENDLSRASLDVDVQVGPSSDSKRAATVRAVTGMLSITADPEMQQVLSALALMNMEGEGINDVRDYQRQKLIRMGAVKPTEEEKAEIAKEQEAAAQKPPDPNSQYLLKAAEEAEAKAAAARADTVETLASADLKRAQTQKTIAETMGEHNSQQINSHKAVREFNQPDSQNRN